MKRKLLLAAVALLCSVGSWAQSYSTTDLESAGWTKVTTTDALSSAATAGNYFVLIDAGTSNYAVTHSLYLGNRVYYQATVNPCDDAGELWNLEPTETANQYNLRNVSTRRYPSGWDNYMRETTTEQYGNCATDFSVSDGRWTLKRESNEVGPWNNDKAVNIGGTTEPHVVGYENVAANKASGQPGFYVYTISASDFLSLSINGAAANNGKNVSFLVKNPGFETGDTYGWTLASSEASSRGACDATDNTFIMTNSQGYRLFNTWPWGQPITQEIASIPNGRYKLQAVVANSSDGDPAKVYLLANNDKNGITCNVSGAVGVEGFVETIVTDNSLTIGAVGSNNDADRSYIENGLWWFKVDNFRLYYYGNAVEVYSPATFTSGSSATANTWYEVTIGSAGTYKVESSAATTLYYTQDDSDDADATASVAIAASGYTTIVLAAGKFYFKSSNASNITLTNLDGTYYLYSPRFERFLSRGDWWGTRAVVDKYGTPVTLTTDVAAGTTTIKSVDNDGYVKDSYWLYTDGTLEQANHFIIQPSTVEGYPGYQFLTNELGGTNYFYVNSGVLVNDSYGVAGNSVINDNISNWNQTVWQLKSIAEHDAIVNAYPNANKTVVITASGKGTTVSDFDTYLNSRYPSDVTDLMTQPSVSENLGTGWKFTPTARTNDDYPLYNDPYVSFYKNTGYFNYTIPAASLPAGIYKVEMAGFDRRKSKDNEASLYAAYGNIGASYLEVNGQRVRIMNAEEMFAASGETDKSWAGQLRSLNGGYAQNVVYVYLNGEENLDLTIEKPDFNSDGSCLVFGNFKLTYYPDDEVLNHKYAIVNNKGDLTSLINGTFDETADGWSGGNRVTGLARSWHSGSVQNPFYETTSNGSLSYTLGNMPAGTYKLVAASRASSGCTITPQIAGTSGATLTGVGDTQSAATEINLNGVQMPYSSLGGFTTNTWGHNWQWITAEGELASDGNLVISFDCVGNAWMPIDDVHLYCTELDGTSYTRTVGDGGGTINTSTSVVTADIVMENPNTILRTTGKVTTAAGEDMNNNQYNSVRITKLVLYDGYNFTNSDADYGLDNGAVLYRNIPADTWCTLTVPFCPNNLDTKMVPASLVDGVLTFEDAASSGVNDAPMLVKSTAGTTVITGTRNSTSGITKGNMTSGSGVIMNGTYSAMDAVPTGSYVVARVGGEDNLYKVNTSVSLNTFRAYFTIPSGGDAPARISLNFDGDATGINELMMDEPVSTKDAVVFDLSGRRVQQPTKGLYIVNGKKVFIK